MRSEMKKPGRLIPLDCVDKCELALDEINEPALIHAILNLKGEIDPVRLNQAMGSAQDADPIICPFLEGKG